MKSNVFHTANHSTKKHEFNSPQSAGKYSFYRI